MPLYLTYSKRLKRLKDVLNKIPRKWYMEERIPFVSYSLMINFRPYLTLIIRIYFFIHSKIWHHTHKLGWEFNALYFLDSNYYLEHTLYHNIIAFVVICKCLETLWKYILWYKRGLWSMTLLVWQWACSNYEVIN